MHVINPVKYLYHFLSNYCMCACYKSCNFCTIFYPITVFIFITFQKFFKKALELSYHPIRPLQSHITIMHLASPQTFCMTTVFSRLCTTKTWNFLVIHYFLWKNCRMCSLKILLFVLLFAFFFFSLPLIFTLLAASISHFLTAAMKFSCFSSNEIRLLCFNHSLSLFLCYPRECRHRK